MRPVPWLAAVSATILFISVGCESTHTEGRAKDAGSGSLGDAGPIGADAAPDAPACRAEPVVMPTLPDVIPDYLELDPATGLHVTGDYQVIDPATWRLKVTGKVDHPLDLSYEDLRCLPKTAERITIVCRGFFEDTANFSGVVLSTLLASAGLQPDADTLILKGADGYSSEVPLESALSQDNLIAYEWEDQPLPILHGFPARALFPRLPGSASVKWLLEIEAKAGP